MMKKSFVHFQKILLNHFIYFNLLGFSSFQKIDNHFEKIA